MKLKENKNIYVLFMLLVMITCFEIGFVSASLGTFKQGECVNIKTILNSTYVNISSLSYPNSTVALTNQAMTKTALTFNYTFCNTSTLGTYIYDYFSDESICGNGCVNSFTITQTGQGNSNALFFYGVISIFLITLMGGIYMSWKMKKVWAKMLFICVSYLVFVLITFLIWQVSLNFISISSIIPNITYMMWIVSMACFLPFIIFMGLYILDLGRRELEVSTKVKMGWSEDEARGMR